MKAKTQGNQKSAAPVTANNKGAASAKKSSGEDSTKAKSGTDEKQKVSEDEIRTVAYLKYLDEGSPVGRHKHHWLEAESQLSQGPTVRTLAEKKDA